MGQYLREFAWTSQAGKYVSAASIVKNCCSIRPHLMGSVYKWSSCDMKCALNETCNDLFFLDTWGKWKEDTNTAVLQIPSVLVYLNKRPELKKKVMSHWPYIIILLLFVPGDIWPRRRWVLMVLEGKGSFVAVFLLPIRPIAPHKNQQWNPLYNWSKLTCKG